MTILYPAFLLMGLTLVLTMRLGLMRYRAVQKGTVDPRYFVLYRGYDEPEKLAVNSRHIVNLFEAPVLYYAISIIAFVTNQGGTLLLALLWAYVALRIMHSYVHLTSNKVIVRFRVFALSQLTLLVCWAVVLTGIMRQ